MATLNAPRVAGGRRLGCAARRCVAARASAPAKGEMGFDMMRRGVKVAADETLLSPRFYTTDFDEMEELFSAELNPNLDMAELEASVEEFRKDYNQTHFVRNSDFKSAADNISGATRKIFVEFLERSCTAEFSGFLLYKELGRRLKKINPVVAEGFTLMSRDEARHAGFLNKALTDFHLALDLGFLTKNRKYTFFKPKFIFYATYLSERIGYWRYISIYRHLQRNPDNQLYPLFEYFENWCQVRCLPEHFGVMLRLIEVVLPCCRLKVIVMFPHVNCRFIGPPVRVCIISHECASSPNP
jgi:magnesium-protoporphyrin IX monomethyl ester (oxidative) cyclase